MVAWFTGLENLWEGFFFQFRGVITHCKRVGYNLSVVRQSACLAFDPVMVGGCAVFFGCAPADYYGPGLGLFILVGWDRGF